MSAIAEFIAQEDRHGKPLFRDARVIGLSRDGQTAVIEYMTRDVRPLPRWVLVHDQYGPLKQDRWNYALGCVIDGSLAGRILLGQA